MPTRTVSTFNGITQAAGQANSLIVATGNQQVKIFNIEGFISSGTANAVYFLQLFAQATVPAAASVPLRSLQVLNLDGFTFAYQPEGLNMMSMGVASSTGLNQGNLVIVLSTTEHTYTAPTDGAVFDLSVDVEEYELQQANVNSNGTLTGAAVQNLTVWVDNASGAKYRLLKIAGTNSSGGTVYLMLFAAPTPATGAAPIQQWALTNGSSLPPLVFGDGEPVMSQDISGTIHQGCYLYVSSTAQTYTAAAGTPMTLLAFFI
jgi:hypothetical protein